MYSQYICASLMWSRLAETHCCNECCRMN